MKDIAIVSKAGGNSNNLPWGDIQVSNSSSVIKIPVSPNDIRSMERSGQNLVITTRSGETITLQSYFNTTADGVPHDVVFEDSNGKLWQAEYVPATSSYAYKEISSISELLLVSTTEASGAGWLWPLLGAVGVGAAISESSGGNEPFVRLVKPLSPTGVSINDDGTQVVGRGEPGTAVIVRGPTGNVIGQGTVGANGEFQVVLQPPQNNGEAITVVIRNPQGQESDPVSIKAPTGESEEEPGEEEQTAPEAPTELAINAGGIALTGRGEPGTVVQVRDPAGNIVGSGTVAEDGTFTVTLQPPQTDGQTLTVTLTNSDNQTSPAATISAPTIDEGEAPDAPTNLAVNGDGTTLTGRGEPGTQVQVRNPAGNVIGSGTVAADGSFTVTLQPPQTDGETLSVTLTNSNNQTSPAATTSAPTIDNEAPAAPTDLAVNTSGTTLTGRGEPGTQVEVRGPTGNILGTGVVAANGTFTINLLPPQSNGQLLSVTLTDNSNQTSPAATVNAPLVDTGGGDVAPNAPTNLVVNAEGTSLSGRGQPGTTVQVRDANGDIIGSGTVLLNGTFTVTLQPAQTEGQLLSVRLINSSNQISPAATVNAPDIDPGGEVAPDAATNLVINPAGTTLTGLGEPGAQVEVRNASGTLVGSGVVQPNGAFVINFLTPQIDGGSLSVVLSNSAGDSPAASVNAPKVPDQATDLAVSSDGTTLTGEGDPGAIVIVRNGAGTQIGTGNVNSNGTFAIALNPPQTAGETLSVVLRNDTGDSPATSVSAPVVDTTGDAPDAPENVAISPNGRTLSGEGEPGATVIVTDANNQEVGRGIVAGDGSFAVTLNPPQTNGGVLSVTLTNGAGTSPAATVTAPDIVSSGDEPDAATNLLINPFGTILNGNGEPGAHVEVRNAAGTLVGSGTVQGNGAFFIALSPAQADGGTLSVVLSNFAGDSPEANINAPKAPDLATDLAVSADGTTLTGEGDAGSVVTVRNAANVQVGTGTVNPEGTFTIVLTPPQTDGGTLSVVLSNATGDSPTGTVVAPIVGSEDEPDAATDLAINPLGTTLTGNGEIGATVEVRNAGGTLLGSGVVQADGSFSVTLSPAQTDGGTLSVVLSNDVGSSPAANINAPKVPDAATDLAVSSDGSTLSGEGEPGSGVVVRNVANVQVGTGTVNSNGTFTITLSPAQTDGGALSVVLNNPTGNSPPASINAPLVDTSGPVPDAPENVAISPDGTTITGEGEPGSTVIITDATDVEVGRGIVTPGGDFTVILTPPQTNGQTLSVVLSNAAGESPEVTVVAPVVVAGDEPDAATDLAINPLGTTLTGNGEIGATVEVRNAGGTLLGSGVVQADGSFTVALSPAQTDGGALSVVLSNDVGSSPAANINAPKVPDAATDLAVSSDGSTLSGEGEPGSGVVVRNVANIQVGTGTVNSNGTFTITLSPAQTDGGALSVVLNNPTGNSPPASINAPLVDTSGPVPDAPENVAISPDGTTITGEGEPGSTVIITDATDVEVGRGIVTPGGDFTVILTPPQTNGQTLSVVLSNGAGDSPAETVTAPKTPDAATDVAISPDGATVTGEGEEGATVEVRNAAGDLVGTGNVQPGGTFSVTLTPPQTDGGTLSVTLVNEAGNSPVVTIAAPDIDAGNSEPDPATNLAINATGNFLTGNGEAGAAVEVRNAADQVVGTGVVQTGGTFFIVLSQSQTNGGVLSVVLTNDVGSSLPATINAPKAPDAATDLTVSSDGATLSGEGEPDAGIVVRNAANVQVGVGTVNANGTFVITLSPPQTDGGLLTVVLSNGTGNSPAADVSAPLVDTSGPAPEVPENLAITPDGATVTGEGEAGSTVIITNAADVEVGRGVVTPEGDFTVTLMPPQTDGGELSVVLSNGGGTSPVATVNAPKAPDAATDIEISPNGQAVTGEGDVGASVEVQNAAGDVVGTGTVQPDGTFSVTLQPPQTDGGTLSVVLSNATGDSAPVTLVAPQAPDTPTELQVSADGLTLSGEGLPDADVTVRNSANQVIGEGTVAPNGSFSITLNAAYIDGSTLSVVLSNAAGTSPTATILAPKAPDQATDLAVSSDGSTLSGEGEPDAAIVVRNAANLQVGSGTVNPNGTFSIVLAPSQIDGGQLSVVLSNLTGSSPIANVNAPVVDTSGPVPDAPENLAIAPDGTTVTGDGEVGATVIITNAANIEVGRGVVTSAGDFTVTLTPPQTDGGLLSVILRNGTGDSLPDTLNAPTAPDAATDVDISPDGVTVTGDGEPGATVEVRNAGGDLVGSGTVQPGGSFSVTLTPPQSNGGQLDVVLSNPAGESPAVVISAPDLGTDDEPGAAINLAVDPTGTLLTGDGEVGAAVSVENAAGQVVGTGVVQPDGSFLVNLTPAQVDGGLLSVVLSNVNGDSVPATISAAKVPDPATSLVVSLDGETLGGEGEGGAIVTVYNASGENVGSGIVNANGSFGVALVPPQTAGGILTVFLSNPAGNSPGAAVTAPVVDDTGTVPAMPDMLAVSPDGSTLTGEGEPGATVRVLNASDAEVGRGVVLGDGTFSIALDPRQTNGGNLSVIQHNAIGDSPAGTVAAPKAPDAATDLDVAADGLTLTGMGEEGATIEVFNAANQSLGSGVVQPGGNFSITLSPAQTSGGVLSIVLSNPAGSSPAATTLAPKAPDAAIELQVSPDGMALSGEGEVGAIVTVRNASNQIVGTGVVLADNTFSVSLSPAQIDGGTLQVTLTNETGTSAIATTLAANVPDAAIDLEVAADGAILTGEGQPGVSVQVLNALNQPVGNGVVQPDGSFSITLTPPQTDGGSLTVVLSNAAGNSLPATTLAPGAPDAAINLAVSPDGWTLSGEGEAGATVEVRNAADDIVGAGTVRPDGTFLVGLTAVQTDGGELSVVLSNPAGSSAEAIVVAPKAPDAATDLTVTPDGTTITGDGEIGVSVVVRTAGGQTLGTGTVQPDGSFSITLSPAQINGGTLQVVLSNATGSSPVATTLAPKAPDAATDLEVTADGLTLTGEGQIGVTVTVFSSTNPLVSIGTGTVQPGGTFSITLSPAQINGETVRVVLSNATGNSPDATIVAPKAPDAATDLEISPNGETLTGEGEADVTVTVFSSSNPLVSIGSGIVQPDGTFSITLTPPQVDGETVRVLLSNATGDSPDATITAPQPPEAATDLAVSSDGSTLWGEGEPGASAVVRDPLNVQVGLGTVNPNGTFSIALTPPQTNGESLSVVLSNPAGSSPSASVAAPIVDDTVPVPDAPINAAINPAGTTITGDGEPGAVVVVRDSGDIEVGRGVVSTGGSFTVTLTPPQTNGGILSVVLVNGGGESVPAIVTAPSVPDAATELEISANGLTLTGEGAAGTTVTVRDAGGQVVGSGVAQAGNIFSVTLSPPQTDGGLLSVTLSNAAGNSPVATLSAPKAPDAATDVDVNATGTVLTGDGEIGATVQVLNAANQVVGTGTVQPDGSFTISLSPTQNQGGTLSVVLTNTAGSSPAVTLPAPKVPDAPTNVAITPNGAVLTGEGEGGAAVEVRNAADQLVGTGTVLLDGSFTITLSPAQNLGGNLSVILSNPAGNSTAVTLPAPQIPDVATDIEVTPNGATLTGEGEAGATVQVRNASNQVVGNGTVQADGTFSIVLVPPQTSGGTLSVVLSNTAGSSAPATVSAPVVEPIDAFDNLVSAHINLNPTVTTGINAGSANYVAFLNLLNIVDLQVLSVPAINFTVAHGHQSDMRLTYGSLLDLSLLGDVRVVVQVKNASGQWVALEGAGQATLLELSLLSGNAKGVQLNELSAGEYRAFVGANGALGLGLLGSLNGTRTDYDYTRILGSAAEAVSGNVITDAGIGNQIDDVTANTIVARVNNTDIPAGGLTINGTYGVLVIQQNGTYTYTPNNVTANIGKVDTFTYLIRDTLTGVQDSAKLHVRIDSNGVNLVWDAPANNAVTGLVAVNDTATAQLTYKNLVTDPPAATLGSFNATGILGLVAPSGNGTATFTVAANQVANVTFIASVTGLGGVLPGFSITVEKNVNGAWVEQGTASGAGLLNLLGLGATGFALPINNLTAGEYRVKASSNALLGVGSYRVDIRADALLTHLNQYEAATNPGVTGNVLAGDSLGSVATKLLINVGGSYTEVTGAGLTVAGVHGTLVIQHNGSYVYTPNSSVHHTADVIETFTYRLQHPSGEIATATLRITVDVSGAGVASTSLFSAFTANDDIPELDLDLAREDSANISAASENDPGVTLEELIDEPAEEISLAFVSEEPTADLADVSSTSPVEPLASDPLLTEPVAQNDDLWNQPENQLG